ncbi:hypothetical protein BV898_16000 [Hypsibius exemplaris]|uniref:Thyroglobulin type-1 domain-containing protein n=1 Tax=Hypsibius exemplaris TaxID=2072580 RepID=A0A9X6NJ31_HYPEX|nr:hypothetical protein BV898_16000 [Hypsibius exemplaris]
MRAAEEDWRGRDWEITADETRGLTVECRSAWILIKRDFTFVVGFFFGEQKCLAAGKIPDYSPSCDPTTGGYTAQQCNRAGDCWCAALDGGQLGPKWNAKDTVVDLAKSSGSTVRISCDLVRSVFNPRPRKLRI